MKIFNLIDNIRYEEQVMDMTEAKVSIQLAKIKALSEETRLRIIEMLANERLCACDILTSLEINQSTLSYHMKLLTASGLVEAERDGKWMHYSLNKGKLDELRDYLDFISTPGNRTVVERSSHCNSKKSEFQNKGGNFKMKSF